MKSQRLRDDLPNPGVWPYEWTRALLAPLKISPKPARDGRLLWSFDTGAQLQDGQRGFRPRGGTLDASGPIIRCQWHAACHIRLPAHGRAARQRAARPDDPRKVAESDPLYNRGMDFVRIGTLVETRYVGTRQGPRAERPECRGIFLSLASEADGPFRLVREVVLTIAATQSDPVPDQINGVPKPKKPKKPKDGEGAKTAGARAEAAHAGAHRRKRLTHYLEKAIHWFEQVYPGGFSNDVLVRTEVKDKRDAHQLFIDTLAEGRGRTLLDTGRAAEAGTILDTLYRATKIPSRFEVNASHDGLKVPEAGAKLLDALLGFIDAPGPETFHPLTSRSRLLVPAEGSRVLTWPNVTVLPFLADPKRFMGSKPEIFRQIAAQGCRAVALDHGQVGQLCARAGREPAAAESSGAARRPDFIDVQTFVWVTRHLK